MAVFVEAVVVEAVLVKSSFRLSRQMVSALLLHGGGGVGQSAKGYVDAALAASPTAHNANA